MPPINRLTSVLSALPGLNKLCLQVAADMRMLEELLSDGDAERR